MGQNFGAILDKNGDWGLESKRDIIINGRPKEEYLANPPNPIPILFFLF